MQRRSFIKSGLALFGATALSLAGCGSDFQDSPSGQFENTGGSGPGPNPPPTIVGLKDETGFRLGGPNDVLYGVDPLDHTVSRLNPDGTTLWTVGDLGSGDGVFNYPSDLAFDGNGRLYVLDRGNYEIDILGDDGSLLATIGANLLDQPSGLAISPQDGLIYVTEFGAHRISVLTTEGVVVRTFGELGPGPQQLNGPKDLTFDGDGKLHVADSGNARIQVFSREGQWLGSYGSYGDGPGQLLSAKDVLWVPSVEEIWVADSSGAKILVFDQDGRFLREFVPRFENGAPIHPRHLGLGPNGEVYVAGVQGYQSS